MENIQVLVIGRLGELVKKICELELLIEEDQYNEVALLELASYSKVLTAWPIEDKENFPTLVVGFKISLIKLQCANRELEICLDADKTNLSVLAFNALSYMQCKKQVKAKLKVLNGLGRFVGDVPLITLTPE